MAQDNGRPLLDTVAMVVMELMLKDQMDNPSKHPGPPLATPYEKAERIAKNAYTLGLAMVKESLKMQKEWQLVPVDPPEGEPGDDE